MDNFTGPSGSASIVAGNPVVQPFVPTYAVYLQDTWRTTSSLVLDLGLRYSSYTGLNVGADRKFSRAC